MYAGSLAYANRSAVLDGAGGYAGSAHDHPAHIFDTGAGYDHGQAGCFVVGSANGHCHFGCQRRSDFDYPGRRRPDCPLG
jgi:hypothetical protein